MSQAAEKPVQIDVVSDVMCPWCYIGKRRLEQAVALSTTPIAIAWRPYQLDDTLPPGGKDRAQYLAEKFGSIDNAKAFYSNIKLAGDAENIPFNFGAIKVSPNTLDAHRLIRWSGSASKMSGDINLQDEVVEALFQAYFVDGRNIGEHDVITDIARTAGMDGQLVAELLDGDADRDLVAKEISLARQMGVTGVPTFIMANRFAVVGAQGSDHLVEAIEAAAAQSNGADQAPQ